MPVVLTLALMAQDVYDDADTGVVNGFRRQPPTPRMAAANRRGSSFFGAAYLNGEIGVVAFRGSADGTDWVDADLDIGLGKQPIDQWGDALDFFNNARQLLTGRGCKRIVVTGHSLGGGLAQLVAAGVTRFPVRGASFNAPGVAGLKGAVRVSDANAKSIFNFRAAHDPVSQFGKHIGHAPVSIEVQVSRLAVGAAALVGGAVGGVLAQRGLEHTMSPLVAALRASAMGGIRL